MKGGGGGGGITSANPTAILSAMNTPTWVFAARGVKRVRIPVAPTDRPSNVAPPCFLAKYPPGKCITM